MMRRLALTLSALSGIPLGVAWVISQEVLHPKPRKEDHSLADIPLPAQDVVFASRDGTPIAGWFIPVPGRGPKPTVVLSHGWARSRAELLPHAAFLHDAGYAVLAFDYRHRGESGGDAVTMGVLEQHDLLGALDEACARPEVDRDRIAVLGMSTGSVIAILVAARDERVRALVLEAPYTSDEVLMTRSLRHYYHLPSFPIGPLAKWVIERRIGQDVQLPRADERMPLISPRPVFVIAGERDAVVGAEESRRVFEAAHEPKRYWLIPGANHARGWQAAPQEYEQQVLEFMHEALAVLPAPAVRRTAGG